MKKHPSISRIQPHNIDFESISGNKSSTSSTTSFPSFEDEASDLSFIFFTFLSPIFRIGSKRSLEHDDLGGCARQDQSQRVFTSFTYQWNHELRTKPVGQRSLWTALWKTVRFGRFCWAIFLFGLYTLESFGPIIIMNYLVQYAQGSLEISTKMKWLCVALLFLFPMTASVFIAHSNSNLTHISIQLRNILISAIYQKTLRLSPSAKQSISTGDIISLFSTDTTKIEQLIPVSNSLIMAIPTIILCLILIYQQIGVATFVGLGIIIFFIPVSAFVFGLMSSAQTKKAVATGARVNLMNEMLNGIRIIKFYAWEQPFMQKILAQRSIELYYLKRIGVMSAAVISIVLQAIPVFLPVLVFYTYIRLGNTLTASKAFTSIALFNLMQLPFFYLPLGLAALSECIIASKRIRKFLEMEELEQYVIRERMNGENSDKAIVVRKASFGWHHSDVSKKKNFNDDKLLKATVDGRAKLQQQAIQATYAYVDEESLVTPATSPAPTNRSIYTLRNLTFSVQQGQLVAIVGSVGSGKSSLLSAMLGEMLLQEGQVSVYGSIAYCDQRPWILNDTVKNNILFGLPVNEERLNLAVYAANLEEDLKILPGGIETQIGERGINLSGGQKARVALARAVYKDADVYFLDDPLSAVDAHVGQFLFHECIRSTLKGKTRILVTHQVHILPYCDQIIILDEGGIKAVDTYSGLKSSGVDVNDYVSVDASSESSISAADIGELAFEENDPTKLKEESIAKLIALSRDSSSGRLKTGSSSSQLLGFMEEEEKKEGQVSWSVYWYYITSGGVQRCIWYVLFMALDQAFYVAGAYWLQYWGKQSLHRKLSTQENVDFLNIYAACACLCLIFFIFRSVSLVQHRTTASETIHTRLLKSVVAAKVSFFDSTPVGRVLNRFTSDMTTIDEHMTQTISDNTNIIALVVGAVGAIIGATKGIFLILMVPLTFLYVKVQRYFRATSTAVARLESVSRSPIYADFSQMISGLPSIRSYHQQSNFSENMYRAVDKHTIASMILVQANQWVSLRLDFIGATTSAYVAFLAVAMKSFIPAGYLAIGLTFSLILTSYMKMVVRMSCTLESQMNSVERVRYYTKHIVKEGLPQELKASEIPADWPANGDIVADRVDMCYKDGPLVLKDVNFHVHAREKIGVAGRTGSGKSSMMVALFRIQELAAGKIMIDDVDISTIPLSLLRSKLGIIPQDPVMFSATVRFNLDPFQQCSDTEIWQVLECVQMKDHVLSLPNKLQEEVSEGGENFSAGQRQLICIARAILRKPRILVLDEATASIDNETDTLIQQMIREQFKDCTVLTIAHRLNTIIDSDRIMVLDNGNIAEMDHPQTLLQLPDGKFRRLWEK